MAGGLYLVEERCRSRVSFLEDREGRPWTWVMGEHPDDKSVEQIIDEEAKEIARRQAESEEAAEKLLRSAVNVFTTFKIQGGPLKNWHTFLYRFNCVKY